MPCARYDDFGYAVVACVPDLRMTIHQTGRMTACLIHDWWALPFSNRWAIFIDVLIVIQDYFPTYTKQALESLKTDQGFSTLALLTFWATNFLLGGGEGCPVCIVIYLEAIPGLYPLGAKSPSRNHDNQKMSPHIVKCPLGGKIIPGWEPLTQTNPAAVNADLWVQSPCF